MASNRVSVDVIQTARTYLEEIAKSTHSTIDTYGNRIMMTGIDASQHAGSLSFVAAHILRIRCKSIDTGTDTIDRIMSAYPELNDILSTARKWEMFYKGNLKFGHRPVLK